MPPEVIEGQGQQAAPAETFAFKIGDKELQLPKTVGEINLQEAIGQVIGRSRSEAKREYDKTATELRTLIQNKDTTLKDLQEKLEQMELDKMSVEERAKAEVSRELDKLRKEIEKYQGESKSAVDKYRNEKIENQIMAAISRHPDVNNPQQVALLLRTIGAPDVVADQEKGFDKVVLKLQIDGAMQELSPAEAVDKFLGMPENGHFLKNNLRSGGGSGAGGRKLPDGTIQYTEEQLRDPNVRKEMLEKIKRGEKVSYPDLENQQL